MFTFPETLYITEKNDVFVNLENYKVYTVKSNRSVKEAMEVYAENCNKFNIAIDSRLTEIIIYLTLKYGREVVIYNVNENRFVTVFTWSRSLLLLNINLFNEEYLKKILFMYLIVVYYFREPWNANNANEIILQNSKCNLPETHVSSKCNLPETHVSSKCNLPETSKTTDASVCLPISAFIEYLNVATNTTTFNTNLYALINSIMSFTNINNIIPVNKLMFKAADIQAVLKRLIVSKTFVNFEAL